MFASTPCFVVEIAWLVVHTNASQFMTTFLSKWYTLLLHCCVLLWSVIASTFTFLSCMPLYIAWSLTNVPLTYWQTFLWWSDDAPWLHWSSLHLLDPGTLNKLLCTKGSAWLVVSVLYWLWLCDLYHQLQTTWISSTDSQYLTTWNCKHACNRKQCNSQRFDGRLVELLAIQ